MAARNVEPPTITRRRSSSIDQAVIDDMVKGIDSHWRSNGEVYPSRKKASNASSLHRRQVARTLKIEDKLVRSRVWEQNGGTDEEKGEWIFGLTTAPSNGNGNAS